MKIPIYVVDAFSRRVFGGNSAAVCPLESWLYDSTLQQIAAENNLPATTFVVPFKGELEIRWFTPTGEIELCGHGTLAAGWVVLTHMWPQRRGIRFVARTAEVGVERDGDRLTLALPRRELSPVAPPPWLPALGRPPRALFSDGARTLCVYDDAAAVAGLQPDFATLRRHQLSVAVTAPGAGHECDFVSRYFSPAHGADEDAVTGSSHCLLVPYWAERLGRDTLFAKQLSRRGGELWCRLGDHDVFLSGYVTPYLAGDIDV